MCFHTDLQQRVPISVTQQALSFFSFFPPLFIVLSCCLSFALLYQTQILYRKKLFHLIHFFQEIFHIMFLNFLGANNGEQDCIYFLVSEASSAFAAHVQAGKACKLLFIREIVFYF